MSAWQQIKTLMIFELKHSKLYLLRSSILYLLLLYLAIQAIPEFIKEKHSFFILDLIFILYLSIALMVARPQVHQFQKLSKGTWASFFLVQLQHFPCPRNVLIAYRMGAYYVIMIPLYLLFLTTLYIASPYIRELMPLGTYVAFSLIWLAINLLWISLQATFEFGASRVRQILIHIPLVILFYIVCYIVYDTSLVHLSIWIVTHYPLLSVFLILGIISIGIYGCVRSARKRIMTIDYL